MKPIKIEIEIDDMGVSARLFEGDKQKESYWREQPIKPVTIAFKIRELVEKYLLKG